MNKKSPVHVDSPDVLIARAKQLAEEAKSQTANELPVDDVARSEVNEASASEDTQDSADDTETMRSASVSLPISDVIERLNANSDVMYYAPITRIDKEKREVIGTATAEVKDSYGTVIGYDASKDAFARWAGNIREMHDPKKAVGRALEITPDDAGRRIVVRAKISKGAEDTWQKLLDGTLTGFSIGGRNGQWTERDINGEKLPFLARYDQSELSLVDNPSCPSAKDVAIVRADGIAEDVLASEDEISAPKNAPNTGGVSVERAGARLSQETMDAMHMVRDHSMNAAKQTMNTCGCDDCIELLNKVAETDDGDGDMDANFLAQPAARAAIADIVRSVLSDVLRDQVAPTMSRVNALLARDAQRNDEPADITRRVDGLDDQLSKIYTLVEKIAAQPTSDGPVLHGAMDKRLATQGVASNRAVDDSDVMRRALDMGFTAPTDANKQVQAAAAMLRNLQGR